MRFPLSFAMLFALIFFSSNALKAQVDWSSSSQRLSSRFTPMEQQLRPVEVAQKNLTTTIDLSGSALMPKAAGRLDIEIGAAEVKITTHIHNLKPAWSIDPARLTYVLWAVPPNGVAENLGELKMNGTNADLVTATNLKKFATVVTAEPYYAVKEPSRYMVLFNASPPKADDVVRADLLPIRPDAKTPLEISEARNAVRIARLSGAERYAADVLHRAVQLLQQAEDVFRKKGDKDTTSVDQTAREAIAAAEDARYVSEQRQSTPHEPGSAE